MHSERFDEGGLAHPGRTGDTDASGTSRLGKQGLEHLIGQHPVIGAGRLRERDGTGQRATVTGPDALDQGRCGVDLAAHVVVRREEIRPSTLRAAVGMLVPGPKMAATPASVSIS